METVPNTCGYDPEAARKLAADIESGRLIAIYFRDTARLAYVTPEELASIPPDKVQRLAPRVKS